MVEIYLRCIRTVGLGSALLVFAAVPLTAQALTDEQCDLNDDATINALDLYTIIGLLGVQAGEERYRDGLDLVPDGVINLDDYRALIDSGCFGKSAETGPTPLSGLVTDGDGTPLEGVRVQVGTNTVQGCTDEKGNYALAIGSGDVGDTVITFDGSGGGLCTPVDPTPDILSGQYPTIPNKPIFINGGTDIVFREMSLPERDLTGSVDLSEGGIADDEGGGTWKLNQDVEYQNAGVSVKIPAGCTATFPDGEDPVLSITRVDPARLPVPMPPGLSSSIFVTYQPGGTEVECEDGGEVFSAFDNVDGFANGQGDLTDGPFLAGITNGVFTPLVACLVSGADEDPPGVFTGGTVNCGPIPLPFEFAWYHTDIRPNPCPSTTVAGTVRLNDVPMTPVAGATVSVPGVVPVTTDAAGNFSIPNVPAGPNGTRCTSNPFSIRASASSGPNIGASAFTPGVPGGITDVGDIKFGLSGTVQGKVLKLSSVNPFQVVPLEGADMTVNSLPFPECCPTTDANGNYNVINVPSGGYNVSADFFGELPVPGGGTDFKEFFGSRNGSIDFDGEIDVVDFRFTATGAVKATVRDTDGDPVPFVELQLQSFGGDLGSGFVAPSDFNFGFTDINGMDTISGVPQGPCELTVTDFSNEFPVEIGRVGPEDGCFVNQHGELVELIVEAIAPGDIEQVTVTQGSQGGEDKLVINVDYGRSFEVDSFFDVFTELKIEFDTDQNPTTGGDSKISDVAPDPTGLGVELCIRCDRSGCDLNDAAGNTIFPFDSVGLGDGPNGPDSSIVILVPKNAFVDAAGGPGTYNAALLSELSGGGFDAQIQIGFGNFDVVPNGGSGQVNSEGFDQVFPDVLGDTFGGFFFPE